MNDRLDVYDRRDLPYLQLLLRVAERGQAAVEDVRLDDYALAGTARRSYASDVAALRATTQRLTALERDVEPTAPIITCDRYRSRYGRYDSRGLPALRLELAIAEAYEAAVAHIPPSDELPEMMRDENEAEIIALRTVIKRLTGD
jgi:hypothetical protein